MASKSKKLGAVADIFEKNLAGTICKISIEEISPSENQPRENKQINIESLAKSLEEEGLLQPIIVTKENEKYKIIAGERRFRAAQKNGWKEIECRILKKSQREKFKIAVIENIQRENFDSFEEARAYLKLKEEYKYTDNDLAEIIGKSRNYISEIISITNIPKDIEKKARQVGISGKNLISQLYQATKLGKEDEFLQNYVSGKISTVKKAKEFVQKQKIQKNIYKRINIKASISLSWISNSKISGKIEIEVEKNMEKLILNDLENNLKSTIFTFLKKEYNFKK